MFDRLRERRLPAAEREAARDKRRADGEARKEQSAERRAAALEAEARRDANTFGSGGGQIGGGP